MFMADQDFYNLTGKILIASPYAMEGNMFHQSVIYVVHHAEDGSVGFICNRIANTVPAKQLFKRTDKDLNIDNLDLNIYLGGPNEIERGFFLHSSDYKKNLLFDPQGSELVVSSNLEILRDIQAGCGPAHNLFMVGYTVWANGQMEFELENNLWLAMDYDEDLLFNTKDSSKWEKALAKLGIDYADFSPFWANC